MNTGVLLLLLLRELLEPVLLLVALRVRLRAHGLLALSLVGLDLLLLPEVVDEDDDLDHNDDQEGDGVVEPVVVGHLDCFVVVKGTDQYGELFDMNSEPYFVLLMEISFV